MDLLNFFTSLATVNSKSLQEVRNTKTFTVLYFDMNTLLATTYRHFKKSINNSAECNDLAIKMTFAMLRHIQLYILGTQHLPIITIHIIFEGFNARMLHNKKHNKITSNNIMLQSGTILCNQIEYHMRELLLTVRHNITISSSQQKGEIPLKILHLIKQTKLPCNHIIMTEQRNELLNIVLQNNLQYVYFTHASYNVISKPNIKLLYFSIPAFTEEINNNVLLCNLSFFNMLLQHKHFPYLHDNSAIIHTYYSALQQNEKYHLLTDNHINYNNLLNIILLFPNGKVIKGDNINGCYCYLRQLEWYLAYWTDHKISYVMTYKYIMPTVTQLTKYLQNREYYEITMRLSDLNIKSSFSPKYNFLSEYNCILYNITQYPNYFTKEQCLINKEIKQLPANTEFSKIYYILNSYKYKIQRSRSRCFISNRLQLKVTK